MAVGLTAAKGAMCKLFQIINTFAPLFTHAVCISSIVRVYAAAVVVDAHSLTSRTTLSSSLSQLQVGVGAPLSTTTLVPVEVFGVRPQRPMQTVATA